MKKTDSEQIHDADLVVVGKVIGMKNVPHETPKEIGNPYASLLQITVESWVKGGAGAQILEVFDDAGTDCDVVFGVHHVVTHPNPRSIKWRLYLKKYQGRFIVITADQV